MHIEVQVALNFVISYLYNKLPRRRVNIFGEELEKVLKEKFQGHWYPEKPFKGSAFRCIRTADPTDAVLNRAARESGILATDIFENLPSELSVWIDPGEVSYRIGEKGAVKILYSEPSDRRTDDTASADREVTKTFNPEAQCFCPIDAMNLSLNALSLSPKTPPNHSSSSIASSPAIQAADIVISPKAAVATSIISSTSKNYTKNFASATTAASTSTGNSFLPRSNVPVIFTTATFAQTKFGSTKLKSNTKRPNNRMSPTEFSNYIKQRGMQQQLHHSNNAQGISNNNYPGHMAPVSPSRSLSPNPSSMTFMNANNMSNVQPNKYSPHPNSNNLFDISGHTNHFPTSSTGSGLYTSGFGPADNTNKYSLHLEPSSYYGMHTGSQTAPNMVAPLNTNRTSSIMNYANINNHNQPQTLIPNAANNGYIPDNTGKNISSPVTVAPNQDNTILAPGTKLADSINSFYPNPNPYQHLLVAN